MPDEVAKGFGISVSLDAAGAEGAEPCATQPPQTHTRLYTTNTTQRSTADYSHTQPSWHTHASILCRVRVRDGTRVWLFTESPCSIQVSLAPPPHLALTFSLRHGKTEEGVAYASWWMPVMLGVAHDGDVDDGKPPRDLSHEPTEPTPDGGQPHRDLVDYPVGKSALPEVGLDHHQRRQLCHGGCIDGYSVQLDSAQPVWQMCCYSDWNRPDKNAPGLAGGCNYVTSAETVRALNPTYADQIEVNMPSTCCGTPFGEDPSGGKCAELDRSPRASAPPSPPPPSPSPPPPSPSCAARRRFASSIQAVTLDHVAYACMAEGCSRLRR